MEKYRIVLACDTDEAFASWLREKGHDATVGTSTGTYVDGAWTSDSEDENEIIRELWEEYCGE